MAKRISKDELTRGGRLVFTIDSYKDTGNSLEDIVDTHYFKLVDSWEDNDGIDDYDASIEYNHYFLIDLNRSSYFIYELNLYEAYKLLSLYVISKKNEDSNDELLKKISELIGCAEEEYEEDLELGLREPVEIDC